MSKTVNPHIRLITMGLLLVIWSATATAAIIFVDADAPGPVHDGESWYTAYNFLQDALVVADSGDQIRVAHATYRPDQDSDNPDGTDNRNETFELINGVEIYGGYAGCGAPDPDERKVETYETILSGDIGVADDKSDNSYHVVDGSGTDDTAVLDGFTITGGNAVNTSGGGMFNYNPPGSPTVLNCLFKGNSTAYRGGGMYNWSGSAPILIDCSFENNSADLDGGGLYNINASPTISNCSFTGNSANGDGGGLCNDNSDPVLINCTFSNNIAGQRGGGTYNWSTTEDLEFVNCTYTGNSAGEDGGGMCNWNGTAKLVDCLFSGNSATLDGAAMYNQAGNPTVKNCTFSGNVARGNAGGIFNLLANPTIANCIFWANADSSSTAESAQIQGGLPQVTYSCIQDEDPNDGDIPFDDANIDDDPMFVRDPNAGGDGWGDDPCTPGVDEAANDDFGDLHLLPGSPCIDAGDNTMVPADTHDLDDDLDTTELTPLDLDYNPRFIDDPTTPDTGRPAPPDDPNVVDMGPYEYEYQLVAEEKYCGGTGTAEDPYLICDPNHMQQIGANPQDWDKHFKLTADIDLSQFTGTEFNIIGLYVGHNDPCNKPFTGVFDGNAKTISNFTYISIEADNVGIFSYVDDPHAEIQNLFLTDPNLYVETGDGVGSLVGYLKNGTITDCDSVGTSVSGGFGIGGLVGVNENGTITECSSRGTVKGEGMLVGGLIGLNSGEVSNCHALASVSGWDFLGSLVGGNDGTLTNCHATGNVTGYGSFLGGLSGDNMGTISYCCAAGSVTGWDSSGLGGLVGWNHEGTIANCYAKVNVWQGGGRGGLVGEHGDGAIINCYATGIVPDGYRAGGLVGYNNGGTVADSFWDKETSEQTSSDGGIGKTTRQMKDPNTFLEAGWDFIDETANGTDDIWKICDDAGYPRLWWEYRALDGDVSNDCMVDLVDLAIVSYQWLDVPGDPSADIAPPGGDGAVNSDDLLVLAANWLAGAQEAVIPGDLTLDLTLDDTWMYQNVGSSINSDLTACVSIVDDSYNNSSYTYAWEFILPGDVTVEPSTISGGGTADTCWNFAAPSVNQPQGLSDSGRPLTVKVTVTGVDYANTGSAEVQFGIALLADVNNDTAVNVADRTIINAFWRTGAAGSFTLKDCDVNSDGSVNVADRTIANAVWRGLLGQNSVSQPCPFR